MNQSTLKVLLTVAMVTIAWNFSSAAPLPDQQIIAFSLREAQRRFEEGHSASHEILELGGISRIAGFVHDRQTDDVILVGRVLQGHPPMKLEHLLSALHARIVAHEWPYVSIDSTPQTKTTGLQSVALRGFRGRTSGALVLTADVLLKKISLDLIDRPASFLSYTQLRGDRMEALVRSRGDEVESVTWSNGELEDLHGRSVSTHTSSQSRFWFTPDHDRTFTALLDGVFVINELMLEVSVETIGDQAIEDEDARRFADQFSAQWPELSDHHPILRELKGVFDFVAVADGIATLALPWLQDGYLLTTMPVGDASVPETYPLLQRRGIIKTASGRDGVVQVSGGIELKPLLIALNDGDVSALREIVIASRPTVHALVWALPLEEWEMPNDIAIPSVAEGAREATQGLPGFSLSVDVYELERPGTKPSGAVFDGFPPPPPLPPLDPEKVEFEFRHRRTSIESGKPGGVDIRLDLSKSELRSGDTSAAERAAESRPSDRTLSWPIPTTKEETDPRRKQ